MPIETTIGIAIAMATKRLGSRLTIALLRSTMDCLPFVPSPAALMFVAALPGHTTCHGVSGWGCVEADTLAWFRRSLAAVRSVPSVLFAHIPVQEFRQMWNETSIPVYGDKDEGVCCPHAYSELFGAVKEGGVHAIYSGEGGG